jgi:hypothetical protein
VKGTPINDVKVGARRLRVDDVVKVKGLRGAFRITGMRDLGGDNGDAPNVEVTLYGGNHGGVQMYRTVMVERIGTRKALAGAGAQS